VFTMVLWQTFQNVGMTLQIMPVTGLPLPFISYGGSSLLANALVVGLLLVLSDHGAEPPAAPRDRRRRLRRFRLGTARA